MNETSEAVSAATKQHPIRVALAGNPNSGKTTVFNALTGLNYKVANYPGVTVEKKEGRVPLSEEFSVQLFDLPGTYTLAGESIDEQVAATALEEKPDALIAVIDASNLERNLYLITELIDLGIPLVLALNMTDLAEKRGIKVRNVILSRLLDVPVISLTASKRIGIETLKHELETVLKKRRISSKRFAWACGDQKLIELTHEHYHAARPASFGTMATARYQWINSVVKQSVFQEPVLSRQWSEKIDALVTHRFWGLLIFFTIMAFIFQSIFSWSQPAMNFIDSMMVHLGQIVTSLMDPGPLRSLLIDGVLAGVGSVLVFVPQIAVLFFFIGILEDSGYLCRAAFVMDRVMRKVGLQGRSFIPLLSSFACAVPGIMSTRAIPSIADRFITILVAPLMSCSARIPVYTVLIAAFIPAVKFYGLSLQGLTMLSVYLLGILGAAVVGRVLKMFLFKGEPALFVMEMPPFRAPSMALVLREVWDRVLIFIKSAGTVILACSILLWFLASHPTHPDGSAPKVVESYAGQVGKFIEPSIKPLGFNWEIGIAIFTSFAAREVFVSTLATVYNLESSDDSSQSLTKLLREQPKADFGLPSALSLLVFYVFACQCMSTLAVCRRETGSWTWPAFMFIYMTTLAYGASLITYRIAVSLLG